MIDLNLRKPKLIPRSSDQRKCSKLNPKIPGGEVRRAAGQI